MIGEQRVEAILKLVVERAGAEYVGIQELPDDTDTLLLFNSPATGSTLAVHFNPKNIHQDRLQQEVSVRMAESDALFAASKGKAL